MYSLRRNYLPAMQNKLFLILILVVLSVSASAQSRSSIGFGAGVNKTFAAGYKFGYGYNLQGNIRLNDKWGIVPALGYERLNGEKISRAKGFTPYTDGNISIIYLGVNGKYYLSKPVFVRAGTMLYLGGGNEDLVIAGLGGNFALGYDIMVDEGNNLEFTLRADVISLRANTIKPAPVVGLRVAYNFNFKR